jgi:phosphatidylglycerol:prolipoprotein diacylglycerol transferase
MFFIKQKVISVHTLLHLWGPFSIHSFGFLLALGLVIASYLAVRNPLRAKIMSSSTFFDAIALAIVAGVVGSRLLFVAQNWDSFDHWTDALSVWSGGFSVLGSVIGVLVIMPWYLVRQGVPLLAFFDLIALYAPLLQSIARIGCFLAGCCFGVHATVPWSVTYTDSDSFAPLCVALHPTQLYSSLVLFLIFLCMIYLVQPRVRAEGILLVMYLMLMSIERFMIDFWRGDREFFNEPMVQVFSVHQWVSLGIFMSAVLIYCVIGRCGTRKSVAS